MEIVWPAGLKVCLGDMGGGRLTQVETQLLNATWAECTRGWGEGWDGCLSEWRVGVSVYHHVCCTRLHCKAGVLGAPAPGGDPNMSLSLYTRWLHHTLWPAPQPQSNCLRAMFYGGASLWVMWGF